MTGTDKELAVDALHPDDRTAVRWTTPEGARAWRLVRLSRGRKDSFPPGQSEVMSAEQFWPGAGRETMQIMGEEGAGLRTLARWLLAEGGPEVLLLDGSLPGSYPTADQQNEQLARRLCEVLARQLPESQEVEALRVPTTGDAARSQRLAELLLEMAHWARGTQRRLTLVLYRMETLLPDVVLPVGARIRGIAEAEDAGLRAHLRVLVLGNSTLFDRDGPWSSVVDVASQYRMPMLFTDEIVQQWRSIQDESANEEERHLEHERIIGNRTLDWTGGQPLLVRLFLENLHQQPKIRALPAQPTSAQIRELSDLLDTTGRWLVDHPPRPVVLWRRRLAELVQREPYMLKTVRRYVSGDADREVRPGLKDLYVSGWLGQHRRPDDAALGEIPDPSRLWWGFSRSHRDWARDALLRPERYTISRPERYPKRGGP